MQIVVDVEAQFGVRFFREISKIIFIVVAEIMVEFRVGDQFKPNCCC